MLQHGAQWGDMVTMACARPDRDPEMLALDHIPPWDPREARPRAASGASGVPGGVWPSSGELDAARAGHRCLAHLPSPTRLVARSRPAAARADRSASWTDGFMPRAAPIALEAFASLRFAWY